MTQDVLVNMVYANRSKQVATDSTTDTENNTDVESGAETASRFTDEEKAEIVNVVLAEIGERLKV